MRTGRTDWLPRSRDKIITMATDWLAVLATKATAWGVPSQTVTDLATAKTAAAAKLAEAERRRARDWRGAERPGAERRDGAAAEPRKARPRRRRGAPVKRDKS